MLLSEYLLKYEKSGQSWEVVDQEEIYFLLNDFVFSYVPQGVIGAQRAKFNDGRRER